MPSLHEDLAYMQAAVQDAISILGDYDIRQLQQNREKQTALCYLLVIAGETATRVRNRGEHETYPEIPWHRLAGMRNRLVHRHHRVNLEMVMGLVFTRFPYLVLNLNRLLGIDDYGGD